jgi:hypothetical protein
LGGPVDVAEYASRADLGELGGGVDGDVAHSDHVEGEAVLGECGAGDVVTAALDRQQQPVVVREPHGRGHVGRGGRLQDQRGPARRHRVPDQHPVGPPGDVRAQKWPGHLPGEVVEVRGGQAHVRPPLVG